jgi:hypothetical protein
MLMPAVNLKAIKIWYYLDYDAGWIPLPNGATIPNNVCMPETSSESWRILGKPESKFGMPIP